MKNVFVILTVVMCFCLIPSAWAADSPEPAASAAKPEGPVKGMVTMIDLGAKKCIPCKMMAPILEKLEKEYKDRAAIIFLDVWENPAPARKFRIRGIPTQIFFDKEGNEYYRHTGFLNEESIVAILKKMGVE